MKKENLKISYVKRFGKDGTCYTQNVTIPFELAWQFNLYVDKLKEETMDHFVYSEEDLKIITYLEKINFYSPTFSHLTTLRYFRSFYVENYYSAPKKDKFLDRLLDRNTCFIVENNN